MAETLAEDETTWHCIDDIYGMARMAHIIRTLPEVCRFVSLSVLKPY